MEPSSLPVVESLGRSGPVRFERVRWPGIGAPVLLAKVNRDGVLADSFAAAQRASLVRGRGLAQTLEVFWDEPVPHIVQALPEGISLRELRAKRLGWRVACAVVRAVTQGVATLHEHGFGAGRLGHASVWLGTSGEAVLLGHGLTQLRYHSSPGSPSQMPPEELAGLGSISPELPGDSFRLGLMLMRLAVGDYPFHHVNAAQFIEGRWQLEFAGFRRELAPVAGLLTTLMQPNPADRPRGSLLLEVIDGACPRDWPALGAAAARELAIK